MSGPKGQPTSMYCMLCACVRGNNSPYQILNKAAFRNIATSDKKLQMALALSALGLLLVEKEEELKNKEKSS